MSIRAVVYASRLAPTPSGFPPRPIGGIMGDAIPAKRTMSSPFMSAGRNDNDSRVCNAT